MIFPNLEWAWGENFWDLQTWLVFVARIKHGWKIGRVNGRNLGKSGMELSKVGLPEGNHHRSHQIPRSLKKYLWFAGS